MNITIRITNIQTPYGRGGISDESENGSFKQAMNIRQRKELGHCVLAYVLATAAGVSDV